MFGMMRAILFRSALRAACVAGTEGYQVDAILSRRVSDSTYAEPADACFNWAESLLDERRLCEERHFHSELSGGCGLSI